MSEGPRRLLDHGNDLNGLLRGALESERSDDIDAARLKRIGRRLAAATATAATTTPVHAAEGAPSAPAATKASWLASKGPLLLLAAVGIGGVTTMRLRETAPRPVGAPRTETTMTAAAPPPAPEPATISPADLPSVPAPAPAAPPRPITKPAAASSSSDADEIALLARAHDALHDAPARSLALCKEHEKRWVAGQFAQEREAVAIEALVYLGRRDEAGRRWAAFRERYPSSSHRVHLEGLLAPAQ